MALTVTITDNQNGTGATATIAGQDAGQTVTVFVSPFEVGTSPLAWTSAGSRVGNGTVSLPVQPAYYYAYALGVVSGVAAVSVPVYFLASIAPRAVLDRYLDAIQAKIQTLTLSGLTTPPGTLPASRVFRFDQLANEMLGL